MSGLNSGAAFYVKRMRPLSDIQSVIRTYGTQVVLDFVCRVRYAACSRAYAIDRTGLVAACFAE